MDELFFERFEAHDQTDPMLVVEVMSAPVRYIRALVKRLIARRPLFRHTPIALTVRWLMPPRVAPPAQG